MAVPVFRSWTSYLLPIHRVKKYYGEKYAIFFLFFTHYQAFLLYPSAFGIALFIHQISDYVRGPSNKHAGE